MIYSLIFAGGVGSRMNISTPKQFLDLLGKPVIIRTIEQFQRHSMIDAVCVVCLEGWIPELQRMVSAFGLDKVKYIVPGAATGQQSIYNGLKVIHDNSPSPSGDIVLMNDGVRPFVSQSIITRCIECVREHGSAVTSAPVPDTIGIVEGSGEISDIPDRSKCHALKAPQGFWLNEIISVHHQAMSEGSYRFTNSAELFRHYGHKVYTVVDEGVNFKVTSSADIEMMRALFPSWVEEGSE